MNYEKLADKRNAENSETIRKRVQATREHQLQRFTGTKLTCNTEMGPSRKSENMTVAKSEAMVNICADQSIGFIPWFPLATGALARQSRHILCAVKKRRPALAERRRFTS